ncbi:MAG: hypothetical protein ACRKFN_08600 [Desulfitobacterium sp.]
MPDSLAKNDKSVKVEVAKNAAFAKNAEMQMKDAILDKILAKVLEANDIEVPQDLVDNEVAMMVRELKHKLKYESMVLGGYTDFRQEDLTDQMDKFREEAFKSVKTRIVLKGIIEAESFEVTKEELEEEAKSIAARQSISIEMVKDFLGEDLELLRDDLLVRKAIDFVYVNAIP